MKRRNVARWLLWRTTEPPADPPADPPTDPPADPPPSDNGGDPPADPGDGGTPLSLEEFPEGVRAMLEGITTQEELAARLKGIEVPEAYTIPTDLPEGQSVDQATFDAFSAVAKELGLSQAQMEAIVKFDTERMTSLPNQVLDRVLEVQQEGWKADLQKMSESMGSEKYKAFIDTAVSASTTLLSKEILAELDSTGLGDSPLFVKIMHTVHEKLMKEDAIPPQRPDHKTTIQNGDADRAKRFYDSMKK